MPPQRGDFGTRSEFHGGGEETPFGFAQLERGREAYIPTSENPALRDRAHGDWGQDDYVTQGMKNFPDGQMPFGQFMPTERDIPAMVHDVTMKLGRFAPPMIGMPAITMGRSFLAGTQAYQKGQLQAAQLNRQNYLMHQQIVQDRLQELLRKYSNAYATYGPDPSKPGSDFNEEKFHDEISRIANEYGDSYVQNILASKDWGALDRHLKHLDGTNEDLKKQKAMIDLDTARARNKILKGKIDDEEHALDPFRVNPATGATAPSPPAAPSAGGAAATAPSAPTTGANDIPTIPDKGDVNFDINNLPSDRETPDIGPDEPGTSAAPAVAAPPPAATPASLAEGAKAAGAPIMAKDDEPDEEGGDGGGDQPAKPSPAPTGAPAAAAPGGAAPSGVAAGSPERLRVTPWKMAPSAAIDAFHKMGLNNDQLINEYALKLANKTLTQSEASALPKSIRRIISARAAEYEQEYQRVAKSDLKGKDVIDAVRSFDPYFAASLETYTSGRAPPPMSAWQNAAYQQRVWALGKMVDPTFDAAKFKERISMYNAFSHGPQGRTINSIATLHLHAGDMVRHLEELKRENPYTWQLYLGGSRFLPAGMQPSARTVELINQLGVDQQTVRDEFAKAIGGTGGVHVGAQEEAARQLDFRGKTPEAVIASLHNMEHLALRKMQTYKQQYDKVMGPMRGDLGDLIDIYAGSGDTDPNASEPNSAHAKDMLRLQSLPAAPAMPNYRQVQ
jgi:hypothetical protein